MRPCSRAATRTSCRARDAWHSRYIMPTHASALLLLLALCAGVQGLTGAGIVHSSSASAGALRITAVTASAKRGKKKSSGVNFAATGSTDVDGTRRGSFGIGESESVIIWGLVLAALVFGGALDDETAQKIGEAQRSFYPKPPGL